ncbi:cellulase family glycosylhydrolase, partial [Mycobacterium sp.]|uniref:cellulase family glycosylhydrolase n=1 Tax=Mycobacterium sp. TaxID=1785 RepID=UPI00126C7380
FSWPLIPLGSPGFGAAELTPFFDQVTAAIRAVDPTTPVWTEPNLVFEDELSPVDVGTVPYSHIVLTPEDYCLTQVLFSSNFGCSALENVVLDRAQAYGNSHDVPVVVSEFGWAGTGDQEFENLANQHEISWINWSFMSNNDITGSSRATALVANTDQPPVGANINTANLETLAEPYPQTVSGTPNSFSFDDGVFRFSYSVE